MKETRRDSILQRMSTFIRELLGRRRFARPSGAPYHPIVYTRRAPQPLDTEHEAVQEKPDVLNLLLDRRTQHRDDNEDLGYD